MARFLLTALLGLFSLTLFAQDKDIKDVEEKFNAGKYDEAKEKIDKYLSNEKNAKKADGWYYKAVVYNAMSKNDNFKHLSADPKEEAFEAYKKYIELDPKVIMGTINQNVTLFDIFYSYNDMAIQAFNRKSYDSALTNFKKAAVVEDYIVKKDFTYNGQALLALDTTLILNSAAAAIQAKKIDEAAEFYGKLAEAKIAGKDMVEIYEFLVNHYQTKGDLASRDKYLAIGKELFPENAYWCEALLYEAGDDAQKKFAKYDELINGSCGTYNMIYNFSAELFNYLYTQENKPADYTAKQEKIEEVIKKGLAKNSTPELNLLLARHLYNYSNDLNDQVIAIKGTKPEDVKKKNDLKAQLNPKMEDLLKHATTAYDVYATKTELKPSEKGSKKVAANLVLYYYEVKKDTAKIAEWQAKMKE